MEEGEGVVRDEREFVLRELGEEELLSRDRRQDRGARVKRLEEEARREAEVLDLGDEDGALRGVFELRHRLEQPAFVRRAREDVECLLGKFALLLQPKDEIEPVGEMLRDERGFEGEALESGESVRRVSGPRRQHDGSEHRAVLARPEVDAGVREDVAVDEPLRDELLDVAAPAHDAREGVGDGVEETLGLVHFSSLVRLVHVEVGLEADEVVHDDGGGRVVRAVVEGLGVGVGPVLEARVELLRASRVERAGGEGEIAVRCGVGEIERGRVVLRDHPRKHRELRDVRARAAAEVVQGEEIGEVAQLPLQPVLLHLLSCVPHHRLVEDRDVVRAVVRSPKMEVMAVSVGENRCLLLLRRVRGLLGVNVSEQLAAVVAQLCRHGEVGVENNDEPLGPAVEDDLQAAILVVEKAVTSVRDPVRVEAPDLGHGLLLHRRSGSGFSEDLREVVRGVRFELLLSLAWHDPLAEHFAEGAAGSLLLLLLLLLLLHIGSVFLMWRDLKIAAACEGAMRDQKDFTRGDDHDADQVVLPRDEVDVACEKRLRIFVGEETEGDTTSS